MRWKGRRQSENVVDQRGSRGKRLAVGGGIGGIIVVVLTLLFGGNPLALLQQGGDGGPPNPAQQEMKEFLSVVLADTEDVWDKLFPQEHHKRYRKPKLVLFSGQVESACGFASAAVGPFYCPGDEHVYIDMSFFEELKGRLGAEGDFAVAYVLAHEVGHHVQKQLGYTDLVDSKRGRVSNEGGERVVGPAGVASRLPGRRVGAPRPADQEHP